MIGKLMVCAGVVVLAWQAGIVEAPTKPAETATPAPVASPTPSAASTHMNPLYHSQGLSGVNAAASVHAPVSPPTKPVAKGITQSGVK